MDGLSSTFIAEFVFVTVFSVVSFFVVRTLRQIDANQLRLFEKINEMEIRLARLQAEHDIMMCKHLRKED